MRFFNNISSPLFYLILLFSSSRAQTNNYTNLTFDHISIEDGLSQITVHSILQDCKGFIWFGTEDGLNRYDGYNFIVYQNDPSDTNSISDNFIWSIFEDSEQNIWVGTNSGGLNKYSYSSNSFTHYSNESRTELNNIRVILEDSRQNIFIGTDNNGLFKFNNTDSNFVRIDFEFDSNLSIRALYEDNEGMIWIGTNQNGLIQYNPDTEGFIIYDTSNSKLKSQSIWALIGDSDNSIWIGTYQAGLAKFDNKSKRIINIEENNDSRIVNGNITSLFKDDKENLWICTEGGLSIYSKVNNKFLNYQYNPSDLRSLSNSLLRSIYKDNLNLIWIGTVGGGVNKLNLEKKFNQFNHSPSDESSLSNNMIRAMEEDSKGNLWIGTLGSGINRYDRIENKYHRINLAEIGLSSNVVTSIFEDRRKNFWIGTWGGGLNRIKFSNNYTIIDSEIFIHSSTKTNSISSNIVQDIYEDTFGNLWIGTEDGLNKYDPATSIFTHFKHDPKNDNSISDNRIQSRCIFEDKFGYLWIGTWNGLNKMKREDEEYADNYKFERFYKDDGLSDNRIISLYEDTYKVDSNKQIIWVGTIGGGLNKMVITKNKNSHLQYSFEQFKEKDGLPSNVIYGIIGDNERNLWLSTNNGLSKYNINTGKFRNYSVDDGLQSNQFFWGAFHKTRDNEFYFGGINGLNSFFPDQLIENKNIPPVYVTSCNIESTDGSFIKVFNNIKRVNYGRTIELPYDSYNIQFEYVALDYITPSKNRYKTFLENFDENWSNESFSNTVRYNNVHEGEYLFNVIGANSDGLWNENGSSVGVIIMTPFWKTWWFFIILTASILGVILFFITNQIKNALALERLRTKLAADLHDNIGSSLTEISILSEVITTKLNSSDKEIIKNLDNISHKSRSLIDKMSDIVWLVNPQRDTLYDLILRLQDTYSELLSDTEISFRCKNLKSLQNITLNMENRQHLFLIFKEAINNAITHSECTELILNANVSGKKLKMVLSDNGKGFKTTNNKAGNGLKNMYSRSSKIGGDLSINSDIGIGTIVEYIGTIK